MRQPLNAGDAYHIPTAVDKLVELEDGTKYRFVGVSGPNCPISGVKFRWLNTQDQKSFADFTRTYGPRPGYTLTGAGLKGPDLKKLVDDLGLPSAYVDIARHRIAYAEFVLAHIPLTEVVKRQSELSAIERHKRADMDEAHMDRMRGRGIEPFRRQVGEILDRKEFHTRDGKPFVSLIPAPQGG